MKQLLTFALLALLTVGAFSCKPQLQEDSDFKVSTVVVPDAISAAPGDEVTFRVYGKVPQETDKVVLVAPDGAETLLPLSSVTEKSFGFCIPEGFYSDNYTLWIERDQERIKIGSFLLNVYLTLKDTPAEKSTVYGLVHCKGAPVVNAVVSDGIEVVKTNENGFYQMTSKKAHGYVFISIPSGYTVKTRNSIPQIHQNLVAASDEAERIDFNLIQDEGQQQYTMIVMGDIHLANRNNDINQFEQFTADVNQYMAANPGKYYGLTLGDLAWDNYWNSFDLNDYVRTISTINAPVFNTMGNHDNDLKATGDVAAALTYKKIVGPTYYSYNIGKVHYVVLDNIKCNYDGKGDNDKYTKEIVSEQINWLKKDLACIAADAPVVLSMHAQFYGQSGENALSGSSNSNLVNALGSRPVHIMSGHTHLMYNVIKNNIYEHNTGSICATWWWTGSETPGIHISQDGTPGGYLLFEVNDDDFKWVFKSIGKDKSYQFRAYDRNDIELKNTWKYIPDANEESADAYNALASVKAYASKTTSNEVYINVWNHDSAWKVEVSENGNPLNVTKVEGYDPLHTIAYPAKRLNKNYSVSFETQKTKHMFKVTASAPNTTLEVKVTDRFGNVYTKQIYRPTAFTIENYL